MEKEFINFVADVLNVDPNSLSMETKYKTDGWDSLKMMTLIMEIEAEYDVNIPIEKVSSIVNLRDLYGLVFSK